MLKKASKGLNDDWKRLVAAASAVALGRPRCTYSWPRISPKTIAATMAVAAKLFAKPKSVGMQYTVNAFNNIEGLINSNTKLFIAKIATQKDGFICLAQFHKSLIGWMLVVIFTKAL